MTKNGPDFYDQSQVFNIYSAHRSRPESPNETMEQPILWNLIGDVHGQSVLDLGCGEAKVAKRFKDAGAKSYLGVDGSKNMIEQAQLNCEAGFSAVTCSWLEDFSSEHNSFDLIISSLALHYIEDLDATFKTIFKALKPGGRFIFSVEHPVITSSNKALENTALRQSWIVDDYFLRGERSVLWMGDEVKKYHRTIEDFLNLLTDNGFNFKRLRESDPPKNKFTDVDLLYRRRRIPLFLFLSAEKPK
jgi:SAM-dependent methyltransferase